MYYFKFPEIFLIYPINQNDLFILENVLVATIFLRFLLFFKIEGYNFLLKGLQAGLKTSLLTPILFCFYLNLTGNGLSN